jgi:hypothetical protein
MCSRLGAIWLKLWKYGWILKPAPVLTTVRFSLILSNFFLVTNNSNLFVVDLRGL